jgi:hypothetical protein
MFYVQDGGTINKEDKQKKSSPVICIKYACKLRGIVFQNVGEITSTDF